MENKKIYGYTIASKKKRFIAYLVDTLIILFVLSILILLLGGSPSEMFDSNNSSWIRNIISSATLGAILGAIFYPKFTGNIGHKICDLKVISLESGEDFNVTKDGALREGLKHVSNLLFIPSIFILWDKNNQNLYDKITKTVVVEKTK
jgi:uncharacterized RDD family membrane protein YckC